MKKYILSSLFFLIPWAALCAQGVLPEGQLSFVKNNFTSIPNGEAAYRALIAEADKALETELVPVTEKSILAASGDPHDYVSMGPYWWPDPEKPDGLPYIRRDGERNPESYRLDRTKIDRLLKTVRPLSLAYYFTGEEKYARKAVGNLRLWFLDPGTRMNPHFDYAQMIPGHNGGKGRAAGVIDGYSFIEIVESIPLLENSPSLGPEDLKGLKKWFSDLTDWLLSSAIGVAERNATNNHGIAYDVQVVAYSMFAGRDIVAREIIGSFPESRLFAQIRPDGSQPRELERTMALHYSLYNLEHILDMCLLAKRVGVPGLYQEQTDDGSSVARAISFISGWLGKEQVEFPYQQINDWPGNQEKLAWMLRRSTFFVPETSYDELFRKYIDTPSGDLRWLTMAKPNG